MKKVLVIGGAGFLGSHVADNLSDRGFNVTIFDSIQSPWIKPNQRMTIGNIMDMSSVSNAVSNADIVYNFAAISDLNKAIDMPYDTAQVNIIGNINVLEACRENGIKRFIYASTVYVSGREGGFYRCTKRASEEFIEEYYKKYGLEYTILRYGSLYGPRSDNSNGLYRLIKQALENKTISYFGHKDSIRQYIHVIDAARASVKILSNQFICKKVVLTGSESTKVEDLLKMIGEILGISDSSIVFNEQTYIGHYIRTPYAYNSELAYRYSPDLHVDLGQGLLDLIESIRDELKQSPITNI